MIRNIVFDMGMVLLDYNPYLPCLRNAKDAETAQILNKAIFGDPAWGPMIDGGVMTEQEYLVEAQKRLPTPELKQLAADVMNNDWWLDGLYPKSGMAALLGELLEKGYRLYVLSNCGFAFHDFKYKITHLDRFSGVLISAEEKLLKPDAAIYHRLCDKFGLKAEECIFIDDLQKNIDGAKAVGMQGYCFADGDVQKLRECLMALNA